MLYDATDGDDWANNDGWLATEDLGEWHGVTTDGEGRVTGLVLSGNGSAGSCRRNWGT